MLVNQILAMKAEAAPQRGHVVVTIDPDATVEQAAQRLSEMRIGAIVVSSDGLTPEGILSERDIVREIGKKGATVLGRKVREVMTSRLATCHTGDTGYAILERMTEGRFRHLPVVDEAGRMIGLVSIGDAVSSRLKELAAEKEALTGMIMGA